MYRFGRRKWNGYPINYWWQYNNINARRPPLVIPRKGHGPKKAVKTRNVTRFFNNEWQENRYMKVENIGMVEACQQRGIQVVKPEDLFTPHIPEDPQEPVFRRPPEALIKGPIRNEQDHPHYHQRVCFDFNWITHFPRGQELESAQLLLKTVQLDQAGGRGLPERLVTAAESISIPDDDSMVRQSLMESHVFDATQQLLPRNVAVPYIGWHPVEDRMFRKMPYAVDKFSWGRNMPREYGIPGLRKK